MQLIERFLFLNDMDQRLIISLAPSKKDILYPNSLKLTALPLPLLSLARDFEQIAFL